MKNHEFAICLANRGYEVSLEVRKLYEVVADADAAAHGQLRVIDESGEDYLFPAVLFERIALPDNIAEHVHSARAE